MGYRIVERTDIDDNTRAYLSFHSFSEYFLVNFIVNLIVLAVKIVIYLAFFPISIWISVIKRMESGKSKFVFTIVWIIICVVAFLILSA